MLTLLFGYHYFLVNITFWLTLLFSLHYFLVNIDIQGSQTLPPDILVTNLKPDLVVIDRETKKVDIFELTVPGEHRIEISNKLKSDKYQHFLTDITHYQPTVTAFEVGA